MAKVVEKRLKHGKSHQTTLKRTKRPNGAWVTLKIIDSNSPTLFDDLTYAFSNSVARARKDNDSTAYKMGYSDVDALLSAHFIDATGRLLTKKKKKPIKAKSNLKK